MVTRKDFIYDSKGRIACFEAFSRLEWQISLPFSYTSTSEIPTLSYIWSLEKVPSSAEPPGIGHYREYLPPPPREKQSHRKSMHPIIIKLLNVVPQADDDPFDQAVSQLDTVLGKLDVFNVYFHYPSRPEYQVSGLPIERLHMTSQRASQNNEMAAMLVY